MPLQEILAIEQSTDDVKQIEMSASDDAVQENILRLLGMALKESTQLQFHFHEELKVIWLTWLRDGLLGMSSSTHILEIYSRKGEFYAEAPQVNAAILTTSNRHGQQRDQLFGDTQTLLEFGNLSSRCSNINAASASADKFDRKKFSDHLSHVSQLLIDVFYPQ